jgi:hypothetical protein
MKILFLSFFLVLCPLLYSQGNLQFNQVVVTPFSSPFAAGQQSTVLRAANPSSITVPAGKVWKIESACMTAGDATSKFVNPGDYLFLDNFLLWGTIGNGAVPADITFPIWLSAGTYNLRVTYTSANNSYTGAISAIEFNIIP